MTINSSFKKRPHIVHAINNLGMGGTETICLEIISQFRDWADNSLLVLDSKHQPRRGEFEELNIPITFLNHKPGQYIGLIYKTYLYFRQHPADGLICWSFGNHAWISIGAKLAGVKNLIARAGNAPPYESKQQIKWNYLAHLGFLAGANLVACSSYVRERLIKDVRLPTERIEVILNGCNILDIYQRAKSQKTNKKKLNNLVIGMVARLDKIKDHKTLIQAMPMILEEYANAELWLIGDGEERENLLKLTQSLHLERVVKFLGNRKDIPELLGQMDLFAFATTEAEGFGIVLIEALAASIPVVASDTGPCAEVLQQGKLGILVPPRDPVSMGKAIVNTLKNPPPKPNLKNLMSYDTSFIANLYKTYLFK